MKMKFEDSKPPLLVTGAVTAGTQHWNLDTYPHTTTSTDGRPRTAATERLWDPATERLAYAVGDMVPVDELDRLVTDSVWQARQRGEQ